MKILNINELLLFPKSERKELLKSLDFNSKKKIFDSIITMTELYQLNKLDSHRERVTTRNKIIKENPNTVFWDYGIHINYNGNIINVTNASKISTNGDIVTLNKKGVFSISSNNDRDYDVKYKTLSNEFHTPVNLNRVITSTFLPIPEYLKHVPFNELESNHKNKITLDNSLKNLEWTSKSGNSRHGHGHESYHSYDHYLVTVDVDNGFKGCQFVLSRYDNNLPKNLFTNIITKKYTKKGYYYYGMIFKPIDIKNANKYHRGFPISILEMFTKTPQYFDIRLKPILGKVMIGKYQGLEFSFMGHADAEEYFSHSHILLSIRNNAESTAGCHFKHVTIKEAIPYINIMNRDIRNDLKQYFHANGIPKSK